jgi:hypothetical protein
MTEPTRHQDHCPVNWQGTNCQCVEIPREDAEGWHYLLSYPDGTVVRCAGNWDVAHNHLRLVRRSYVDEHRAEFDKDPDTVPTLVGAYGPDAVGGPEGKGGVVSLGYTPTKLGTIDLHPNDWIDL